MFGLEKLESHVRRLLSVASLVCPQYVVHSCTSISAKADRCRRRNFLDIDVAANPQSLDSYIQYIEVVLQKTIDGAAALGSLLTRIDMQTTFGQTLMATIERGGGRLLDADMNETSTRLKALQTREQLGIQALQIANSNAQNILQLFR